MLKERIKDVIAEQLSVGIERVLPEARLIEDLGADELDNIMLIMGLEEAFSIEISDEDADKMLTVRDVVKYIGEKTK